MLKRVVVRLLILFQFYSVLFQSVAFAIELDDYFKDFSEIHLNSSIDAQGIVKLTLGNHPNNLKFIEIPKYQTIKELFPKDIKEDNSDDELSTDDESFELDGIERTSLASYFTLQGLSFSISNAGSVKISGNQGDKAKPIFLNCNSPVVFEDISANYIYTKAPRIINSGQSIIPYLIIDGMNSNQNIFINDGSLTVKDLVLNNINPSNLGSISSETLSINGYVECCGSIETGKLTLEKNAVLKLPKESQADIKNLFLNEDSCLQNDQDGLKIDVLHGLGGSIVNNAKILINEAKGSLKKIISECFLSINNAKNTQVETLTNSGVFGTDQGFLKAKDVDNQGALKVKDLAITKSFKDNNNSSLNAKKIDFHQKTTVLGELTANELIADEIKVDEDAKFSIKGQTKIYGNLEIGENAEAELSDLRVNTIKNFGSLKVNNQRSSSLQLINYGNASFYGINYYSSLDKAINLLFKNHGSLSLAGGNFNISSKVYLDSNNEKRTAFSKNLGDMVFNGQGLWFKDFVNNGNLKTDNSGTLSDYSGENLGKFEIKGDLTVDSRADGAKTLDGLYETKAPKVILHANAFNNNSEKKYNYPIEMQLSGDFKNNAKILAPSLFIESDNFKTTGDLFATSGGLSLKVENLVEIEAQIGGRDFVKIDAKHLKINAKENIPGASYPNILSKRNNNGIYSDGSITLLSDVIDNYYGTIQSSNFKIKSTRLNNFVGLIVGTHATANATTLKNIIKAKEIFNTRDNEGHVYKCNGHPFQVYVDFYGHEKIYNLTKFCSGCVPISFETSDEGVIFAQGDLLIGYDYLEMLASRISCGGNLNLRSDGRDVNLTNTSVVLPEVRRRPLRRNIQHVTEPLIPGRINMMSRNGHNCHVVAAKTINVNTGSGNITSSFNGSNIFIKALDLTLNNLGISPNQAAQLIRLETMTQRELPFESEVTPPKTIVLLGNNQENLSYQNNFNVLMRTMGAAYFTLYRGIQGLGLNPDQLFERMFDETAEYVRNHKNTTSSNKAIKFGETEHEVEVLSNPVLKPKDLMNSGLLSVFFEFASNINALESEAKAYKDINARVVLPFEKKDGIKSSGNVDITTTKGDLKIATNVSGQNVNLESGGSIHIASKVHRTHDGKNYRDELIRTNVEANEDLNIKAQGNLLMEAINTSSGGTTNMVAENGMIVDKAVSLVNYTEVTTYEKRSETTTKTTDITKAVSTHQSKNKVNMKAETGVLQEGTKNINANINAPIIIQEAPSNERYVESHTIVHKKGGFLGGVSSCFGGNSRKEIHHNSSALTPNVCENTGKNFIADAYKKFKAIGSKFLSKETNIKAGEEIEIKTSSSTTQAQTNKTSNGLIWNKAVSRTEKHVIHSNPHFENNVNLYAPNVILEKVRGSSDTFKNIKSDTKPIIKEVTDKHEVSEKRQKSLTAGASMLVKLAVGISMMYVNPVAGFTSLSGTTAVVTNAGFSSLCGDAAKSLIENNGDPSKAIKDLSNKQTAINIGKSMLSSGLVHEISNVVGVAPTKELTDYATKAAITSSVNTVLSASIDGQRLEDAIKQGLTSAVISTGSSYLAGQIGGLKPELCEVNHKILHGLLGGVSGGITSTLLNKSFEDGAVSGALSGVVAEVMAEMLSPEIPKDLSNTEFQQEFIERAERSAKWGEFTGTLSAFLAGYDPSIANQVASNAVENNNFRTLFLALAAGVAWEADKILKTYEREGVEAALKHLGISAVEGVAVGKAGVATVRHKTFKSLKKAYDFALSKSPMLRKALGRLEKKIESFESGVSKPHSTRLDPKNIATHEKYKTELRESELMKAERVGNGLKKDPMHRSSSFATQGESKLYEFEIIGGDSKTYKLYQRQGQFNGKDGIFEFIKNKQAEIVHQRFVENGKITGLPNQKVTK